MSDRARDSVHSVPAFMSRLSDRALGAADRFITRSAPILSSRVDRFAASVTKHWQWRALTPNLPRLMADAADRTPPWMNRTLATAWQPREIDAPSRHSVANFATRDSMRQSRASLAQAGVRLPLLTRAPGARPLQIDRNDSDWPLEITPQPSALWRDDTWMRGGGGTTSRAVEPVTATQRDDAGRVSPTPIQSEPVGGGIRSVATAPSVPAWVMASAAAAGGTASELPRGLVALLFADRVLAQMGGQPVVIGDRGGVTSARTALIADKAPKTGVVVSAAATAANATRLRIEDDDATSDDVFLAIARAAQPQRGGDKAPAATLGSTSRTAPAVDLYPREQPRPPSLREAPPQESNAARAWAAVVGVAANNAAQPTAMSPMRPGLAFSPAAFDVAHMLPAGAAALATALYRADSRPAIAPTAPVVMRPAMPQLRLGGLDGAGNSPIRYGATTADAARHPDAAPTAGARMQTPVEPASERGAGSPALAFAARPGSVGMSVLQQALATERQAASLSLDYISPEQMAAARAYGLPATLAVRANHTAAQGPATVMAAAQQLNTGMLELVALHQTAASLQRGERAHDGAGRASWIPLQQLAQLVAPATGPVGRGAVAVPGLHPAVAAQSGSQAAMDYQQRANAMTMGATDERPGADLVSVQRAPRLIALRGPAQRTSADADNSASVRWAEAATRDAESTWLPEPSRLPRGAFLWPQLTVEAMQRPANRLTAAPLQPHDLAALELEGASAVARAGLRDVMRTWYRPAAQASPASDAPRGTAESGNPLPQLQQRAFATGDGAAANVTGLTPDMAPALRGAALPMPLLVAAMREWVGQDGAGPAVAAARAMAMAGAADSNQSVHAASARADVTWATTVAAAMPSQPSEMLEPQRSASATGPIQPTARTGVGMPMIAPIHRGSEVPSIRPGVRPQGAPGLVGARSVGQALQQLVSPSSTRGGAADVTSETAASSEVNGGMTLVASRAGDALSAYVQPTDAAREPRRTAGGDVAIPAWFEQAAKVMFERRGAADDISLEELTLVATAPPQQLAAQSKEEGAHHAAPSSSEGASRTAEVDVESAARDVFANVQALWEAAWLRNKGEPT